MNEPGRCVKVLDSKQGQVFMQERSHPGCVMKFPGAHACAVLRVCERIGESAATGLPSPDNPPTLPGGHGSLSALKSLTERKTAV